MGEGKFQAAMRRVVCNCEACDTTIRLPWVPGMPGQDQPRFENPAACVLRPVMGETNKWYIVDVVPSDQGSPEDAIEVYQDVLIHIASAIAKDVKVGQVGAVATPKDKDQAPDGYYLMKFTSLPYPAQSGDGKMLVEGKYLYKLHHTRDWYYEKKNSIVEIAQMEHVVLGKVGMSDISSENKPTRNRKKAI